MQAAQLFKTPFSNDHYYQSMNQALRAIDGNFRMLHYPFHESDGENFEQAQANLIHYCVNQLTPVSGKKILDVGCGNGTVALYLASQYPFEKVIGVDLNSNNIQIAADEKEKRNADHVEFLEGDAQDLQQIPSNSVDVVFNLESAFHYPDKNDFLHEVHRVLKPNGEFLIADIVSTKNGSTLLKPWKRKMNFHHWGNSDYSKAFRQNKLDLVQQADISPNIIQAFQRYQDYIGQFPLKGGMKHWILKLFFVINAKLVIHTLRKKRRYMVFYGQKVA